MGRESEWHLSRTFTLSAHELSASRLLLGLTFVDTMATVWINGQEVLLCHNMFRRFEADILPWVVVGENQIKFGCCVMTWKLRSGRRACLSPSLGRRVITRFHT
ncbi:hypothetical protein PCI56_28080 [Plesiomonas shigelloides subsp. oncorhynchi]|nr:hypothetical protein [Plesiomonas shigelloides]